MNNDRFEMNENDKKIIPECLSRIERKERKERMASVHVEIFTSEVSLDAERIINASCRVASRN
jgi:hypothetical protein